MRKRNWCKPPNTALLTLKYFWGSCGATNCFIFQNRLFSTSISSAKRCMGALSPQILLLKECLLNTLALALPHSFSWLHGEHGVSLHQLSCLSFNMCHFTLRKGCLSRLTKLLCWAVICTTHQHCLLTKSFGTMFSWHQRMFWISLRDLNSLRMNLILTYCTEWKKQREWWSVIELLWSIIYVYDLNAFLSLKGLRTQSPLWNGRHGIPLAIWPITCSYHLFLWQ